MRRCVKITVFMANEFKCPACSAPMEFSGGDSIFQTCQKCHAPIVIPSDVYYSKEQQIDAEDFATLTNDKHIIEEKVPLDVGAGDVADDDRIEQIISNPENSEIDVSNAEKKIPSDPQLSQLHYLINQGRKIEAIRFYRGIYGCDLTVAKTEVEKLLDKQLSSKDISPSNESTETIVARIENELANGNKINAIKIFLDTFDAGLKESKDVVDAMETGRKVDISGFQRR